MKAVAPPIEQELSVSIGTFLNNNDVTSRKLYLRRIDSIVGIQSKRKENNIMETTTTNGLDGYLHTYHFSKITFMEHYKIILFRAAPN